MSWYDGSWLESAIDGAGDLFGFSPSATPSSDGVYQSSVLADLDIDGDGSIGAKPISSYSPDSTYDEGSFGFGMPDYGYTGVDSPATPKAPGEKPWYSAFLTPGVLGAVVTSGASLLGGMSNMNLQKQQMKAAEEQRKMNQMLELAKLKYQLMGKGGSGGRRASGGGSNKSQAIDQQASAQMAAGYQNLGGNLASIYR